MPRFVVDLTDDELRWLRHAAVDDGVAAAVLIRRWIAEHRADTEWIAERAPHDPMPVVPNVEIDRIKGTSAPQFKHPPPRCQHLVEKVLTHGVYCQACNLKLR